ALHPRPQDQALQALALAPAAGPYPTAPARSTTPQSALSSISALSNLSGSGGEGGKQGLLQGLREFCEGVGMPLAFQNPLLPQPTPYGADGVGEGRPPLARPLHPALGPRRPR